MAGSHKSEGKFRPSIQNSSRLTYEQIWSLHSRQFSDFLIQDFNLTLTVLWNLLLATKRNYSKHFKWVPGLHMTMYNVYIEKSTECQYLGHPA